MTDLNNGSNIPRILWRRSLRLAALCSVTTAVAGICVLGGCGDEPQQQVVIDTTPVAPPPPPAPTVTPIETLMAQHGIDSRVRLSEEDAPDTDPARIAVLTFFDGFVRADHDRIADMLAGPDQVALERMIDDGSWATATDKIARVDLRTGRNNFSDECVLAVFHVGLNFEPQLWTFEVSDYGSEFAAEPTPPGILDKLSGSDWIAAWYRVLADELAKADEPDEKVTVGSVNFDSTEPVGDSPATPGAPVPGAPGGMPGRRPVGEPIEPPGLKPGGG